MKRKCPEKMMRKCWTQISFFGNEFHQRYAKFKLGVNDMHCGKLPFKLHVELDEDDHGEKKCVSQLSQILFIRDKLLM